MRRRAKVFFTLRGKKTQLYMEFDENHHQNKLKKQGQRKSFSRREPQLLETGKQKFNALVRLGKTSREKRMKKAETLQNECKGKR